MTVHQRIRPFNTKDTYPEQSLDNDLCQAVRAGNMVFLRGQVGSDFDSNVIGVGDGESAVISPEVVGSVETTLQSGQLLPLLIKPVDGVIGGIGQKYLIVVVDVRAKGGTETKFTGAQWRAAL